MGMQKCHPSSIPGLNLWDPHGGRKSNPIYCPLTFTSHVTFMCMHYPYPHFKRWLHNTNLPWNWCQGHEVAMSTGTMYSQSDTLKDVPPFPLLHIFLYCNWLVVPSRLKGSMDFLYTSSLDWPEPKLLKSYHPYLSGILIMKPKFCYVVRTGLNLKIYPPSFCEMVFVAPGAWDHAWLMGDCWSLPPKY